MKLYGVFGSVIMNDCEVGCRSLLVGSFVCLAFDVVVQVLVFAGMGGTLRRQTGYAVFIGFILYEIGGGGLSIQKKKT